MSTWPSEADPEKKRVPDAASESRLLEIRREAESKGRVEISGVRPEGAPFPRASSETGYYGIPLLKQPPWTWEIPLYFFVGGAAGAASVIGALADWIGDDEKLANDARWVAAGGAGLSSVLLISDLGRPERFLGMLRVFKLQSPMSMGAWTLAAFGSAAGAAVFANLVRQRYDSLPVRIVGQVSQGLAALFGLPLHNYTGVLIGATAIPVWNKNVKTLPVHFGMSGVQAGVSTLELMGNRECRPQLACSSCCHVRDLGRIHTGERLRSRTSPIKTRRQRLGHSCGRCSLWPCAFAPKTRGSLL